MSDYILEMRNISKSFAGVQALKDVSIRCKPGQVYALVGENGAGKSTLMKILAGAYKADSGEIIYKGQLREQAIRRRNHRQRHQHHLSGTRAGAANVDCRKHLPRS